MTRVGKHCRIVLRREGASAINYYSATGACLAAQIADSIWIGSSAINA